MCIPCLVCIRTKEVGVVEDLGQVNKTLVLNSNQLVPYFTKNGACLVYHLNILRKQ